jgi:hypothetical protein
MTVRWVELAGDPDSVLKAMSTPEIANPCPPNCIALAPSDGERGICFVPFVFLLFENFAIHDFAFPISVRSRNSWITLLVINYQLQTINVSVSLSLYTGGVASRINT